MSYLYIIKNWFYNEHIKDVMTVIKHHKKLNITLYSENLGNRKQDDYWLSRDNDYTCLGNDYQLALEEYKRVVNNK